MRDYLYIWNDPEQRFVVASGVQFSDLARSLPGSGFLLLDHQSDVAVYDPTSAFSFVPSDQVLNLASEDIYSWGNFVWADFWSDSLPKIQPEQVAELLYFSHKAEPLRETSVPGLSNQFLAYAHDDGWYLKLHYSEWRSISEVLKEIVPAAVLTGLATGGRGFWVRGGKVKEVGMTFDVDKVLNNEL